MKGNKNNNLWLKKLITLAYSTFTSNNKNVVVKNT
jgi:hypothetical protein